MNNNIFAGNWNQIKGKIKENWAEITDDDLLKIKADSQKLYGVIEKKYGYTKDEAKKSVDGFIEKVSSLANSHKFSAEFNNVKKSIGESIGTYISQINELKKAVPEQVHKGQEKLENSIESHLWSSLAIAALIGFIASKSLLHKR